MIARVLIGLVAAVAVVGGGYLLLAGGDGPPKYRVVLDNAFGLIEDADVKAAGVRVGKVDKLEVQRRTNRAVVTVAIDKPSFGDFRADVHCSVEPQSLIGEYFLNCDPGTSSKRLREGATIPVEQTSGTIPPDLVNNIMRRPWRERFSIILSELGAGLAARGPDLQATIKRAIPALRETNRVLRVLGENRRTLQALTRDGETVMTRLAGNRNDVARFVSEARDTARASAERRTDLATDIRLLPEFLRRLRPVLRDLGTTARRQTPALRDLRASADELELLLSRLGPFADASLPAIRSLGEAAQTGRKAMPPAQRTVRQARELAATGLDPMRNLRYILEHEDDRSNAIEPNRLSPGGRGFTALESILQYVFTQVQAINVFDTKGYNLKLNALPTPCSAYRNAESVKEDEELRKQCAYPTGPGPAPGIDYEVPRDGRGGQSGQPSSARAAQTRRVAAEAAARQGAGQQRGMPNRRAAESLADYLLGP